MFAGSCLLLPDLRTVLHWCRNPGGRGTCCQRALAAEGDHDAEEIGQQEEEVQYHCMALRVRASHLVEDQAAV